MSDEEPCQCHVYNVRFHAKYLNIVLNGLDGYMSLLWQFRHDVKPARQSQSTHRITHCLLWRVFLEFRLFPYCMFWAAH